MLQQIMFSLQACNFCDPFTQGKHALNIFPLFIKLCQNLRLNLQIVFPFQFGEN